MRNHFQKRISDRYAYLRTAGVLTSTNMANIIARYATFNVEDLEQDWTMYGTNQISNYEAIQRWFDNRLAWLDQQWGYLA